MTLLRKQARIYWTIAILLMACGHVGHAYEDNFAKPIPCSEHHHDDTGHQECPSGESCSHPYAHGCFALPDAPDHLILLVVSRDFHCTDERFPDAPCREIDYPPQRV